MSYEELLLFVVKQQRIVRKVVTCYEAGAFGFISTVASKHSGSRAAASNSRTGMNAARCQKRPARCVGFVPALRARQFKGIQHRENPRRERGSQTGHQPATPAADARAAARGRSGTRTACASKRWRRLGAFTRQVRRKKQEHLKRAALPFGWGLPVPQNPFPRGRLGLLRVGEHCEKPSYPLYQTPINQNKSTQPLAGNLELNLD